MINDTQKKLRKEYIGGSDMPIILGLSNFKTPYQLWLEKTGKLSQNEPETTYQYWGSTLEPIIRQEFIKRNNVEVTQPDTIEHPLFNFIRANVDGFIPSLNAVLEIKTTSAYNAKEWGESGTDSIPLYYLVQVAHYCAVTNADYAYIAVLIGGSDYREYKYFRDFALELKLLDAAKVFWDCVQNNIEPDPINVFDLKMKYPDHIPEKSIKINNNVAIELKTLTNTKKKIKELTEIEEKCKFNLQSFMKDAEVLIDETGKMLASFRTNKRGRTFLTKEVN